MNKTIRALEDGRLQARENRLFVVLTHIESRLERYLTKDEAKDIGITEDHLNRCLCGSKIYNESNILEGICGECI